jgi:hypothetical protein
MREGILIIYGDFAFRFMKRKARLLRVADTAEGSTNARYCGTMVVFDHDICEIFASSPGSLV